MMRSSCPGSVAGAERGRAVQLGRSVLQGRRARAASQGCLVASGTLDRRGRRAQLDRRGRREPPALTELRESRVCPELMVPLVQSARRELRDRRETLALQGQRVRLDRRELTGLREPLALQAQRDRPDQLGLKAMQVRTERLEPLAQRGRQVQPDQLAPTDCSQPRKPNRRLALVPLSLLPQAGNDFTRAPPKCG